MIEGYNSYWGDYIYFMIHCVSVPGPATSSRATPRTVSPSDGERSSLPPTPPGTTDGKQKRPPRTTPPSPPPLPPGRVFGGTTSGSGRQASSGRRPRGRSVSPSPERRHGTPV